MKTIHKRILVFSILLASCQDQLDIENPNAPRFSNAQTEEGIISLAMGSAYVHISKYGGQNAYSTQTLRFHEVMGDAIGVEIANQGLNQIGCPDMVILDNGTQLLSPQAPPKQKDFIRQRNQNFNLGINPLYYEWATMYNINNGSNMTLDFLESVQFSGDSVTQATKQNVMRAWSYFWKGFAYSRIGSMYYAGIINNEPLKTNNQYVTKEEVIAEAEVNFSKAVAILNGLTSGLAYDGILGKLIPNINQVGKGGILTPAMWIRNINTLRARNILVNNTVANMTTSQWNEILTLTTNGIQAGDKVFTLRSNATADVMNAANGNLPATAISAVPGGSFTLVSERLIQDFKLGDKRLANNFIQGSTYRGDANRGNSFNTRWALRNGGAGMAGVTVMGTRAVGTYEFYMAGFHEENELMKAESNIYLGNVNAGLTQLDYIRSLQGAGLAATSGTGLTLVQALEELRRERRVGLAFRGFSFYDARRWDIINTGRTGAVVVDFSVPPVVNTNATIQYNFLDYWDVPDNELAYNPPSATSAPVKNPDGL